MATNHTTDHTPSYVTKLMANLLGINLEQVDGHSEAYLITMPNYINGPAWCMDLVCGNRTERAIYEEVAHCIYPYKGTVDPVRIADTDHQWKRTIKRDGRSIRQRSELFFNRENKLCLRWQDEV